MTNTTNYNLNIVEGTDIVNPLTQFNPNFNIIDGAMKNNADAAVSPATCIKSGTVHTVTRSNTGAEMFIFTATGDWNTGDTMTVDGTPVTPVLPNGSALVSGSYLINAEVLASIKGTKVTIYSNSVDLTSIQNSIDALTDTARYTVPTTPVDHGTFIFDKIGNVVSMKITAPKNLTAIDNTDVATIPEEFRPAYYKRFILTEAGGDERQIAVNIYPSGLVRVYLYSSNTNTLNIDVDQVYILV